MFRSRFALVAVAALALAGCSDPVAARKALEATGITDIKIGGYSMWGCGKDDTYTTTFTGTGVNGKPVSGVVCSDWVKGATVRFF